MTRIVWPGTVVSASGEPRGSSPEAMSRRILARRSTVSMGAFVVAKRRPPTQVNTDAGRSASAWHARELRQVDGPPRQAGPQSRGPADARTRVARRESRPCPPGTRSRPCYGCVISGSARSAASHGAALCGHVQEQSGPSHRAPDHGPADLEDHQGRRGTGGVTRIASARASPCVWRRVTASHQEPGHEIQSPGLIEARRRGERLTEACGHAPARASRQIEPQGAVHAMDALVVPPMPGSAQTMEALPEAPATVSPDHVIQRGDDVGVLHA